MNSKNYDFSVLRGELEQMGIVNARGVLQTQAEGMFAAGRFTPDPLPIQGFSFTVRACGSSPLPLSTRRVLSFLPTRENRVRYESHSGLFFFARSRMLYGSGFGANINLEI